MSEVSSVKKPASKEELIRHMKTAVTRQLDGKARGKPTVAGTAKLLGIHRDTLYEWMKEFGVKFSEVKKEMVIDMKTKVAIEKPTYLISEALVGEGDEVAHIDLLIGDKEGPVGEAFASGMSHL